MRRFYIDRVDSASVSIADAAQLHHLKDVLRLKAGDSVVIFDKDGKEFTGVITAIERKQALIKITASKPARQSQVKLTIACAIPKGDRMDDIIDQLTQLGVARIIPVVTERVVVKLDDARKAARLKRWRTIAQNAALQSQRNTLGFIEPVTGISDVIAQSQDFDLKLIPNLEGKRKLIKDVLAVAMPKTIIALIGPEGDFTPGEVALALGAGFKPVSLGDTVLRVATAAVSVAGYIKFALGV